MGRKRIAELDGLRGVASLFVLFHHAFATHVFWAWIWLEMFFVLSGFLITTILLHADLTQPRAMVNFIIRRGLRIWPVYYLALLGAIAIWLVQTWNDPADQTVWWKCFFYIQFTEGYATVDPSFLDHYATWFRASWSLALEEQYYLLWPLLIVLVRGKTSAMFAFCIALIVAGFYMRSTGHSLNLLLTRGDGLALGSALAMVQHMAGTRSPAFQRRLKGVYAASLALGLAVVVPYVVLGHLNDEIQIYADITRYGNWTVNVFGAALLFFGLIGLLVSGHLGSVRRFFSWRPFTYLGEVSYAVYIYQGLVFVVVYKLAKGFLPPQHVVPSLVAIAISIALGPLSMRFFERPILKLNRYFPMPSRDGGAVDVGDELRRDSGKGLRTDEYPAPQPRAET